MAKPSEATHESKNPKEGWHSSLRVSGLWEVTWSKKGTLSCSSDSFLQMGSGTKSALVPMNCPICTDRFLSAPLPSAEPSLIHILSLLQLLWMMFCEASLAHQARLLHDAALFTKQLFFDAGPPFCLCLVNQAETSPNKAVCTLGPRITFV